MKDVYFHARLTGDGVETCGTPSCTLGNLLDPPGTDTPQGVFLRWHWDGRRLSVRNDRYGFYPVLYFQRDGEICISPSVYRLLDEGAPTEYDYPGLAAFLRLGFFVGEDTPFKGIRALPPNACLEWEDGRLHLASSLPRNTVQDISRGAAMDRFAGLFRAAIRRRMPPSENFAVLLTAGRDSRRILFELCEQGRRPRFCVTTRLFATHTNADAAIAPLVARAVGVPHHLVDQSVSLFEAELRSIRHTNLCADEHQWVPALADFLAARDVETVYDGVSGDILSHCSVQTRERLDLLAAGRLTELAEILVTLWGPEGSDREPAIASLLGRDEAERLGHDAAVARIAADLERYRDLAQPIRSFVLFNYHRREIALSPFGILADVPNLIAPLLDHDLYDFLDTLPLEIMSDIEFREDALYRTYPKYAGIPFDAPEARPSEAAVRRKDVRYARDLARFVLRRRRTPFVKRGRLIPRMLACLLSRRSAASTYWYAPLCLYLLRLESAARGEA